MVRLSLCLGSSYALGSKGHRSPPSALARIPINIRPFSPSIGRMPTGTRQRYQVCKRSSVSNNPRSISGIGTCSEKKELRNIHRLPQTKQKHQRTRLNPATTMKTYLTQMSATRLTLTCKISPKPYETD